MGPVKAVKVTPEMRARASRTYYEQHDRVFRLTESQRKQILNGSQHPPQAPGAQR